MRISELPLSPRCLALVLALALVSSALVMLLPAPAEAACAYSFWVRIAYYSDPELTDQVGECYRPCWGTLTCTGEETENYQVVGSGSCPPHCQ